MTQTPDEKDIVEALDNVRDPFLGNVVGIPLVTRDCRRTTTDQLEPLEFELKRHMKHVHVGPYQAFPQKWKELKAELAVCGEIIGSPSLEIYGHHCDELMIRELNHVAALFRWFQTAPLKWRSDNLIHSSSNAADFSYYSAAANGHTPQPVPSECCGT